MKYLFVLALPALLFLSCSDDDDTLSDEKRITRFEINSKPGTINTTAQTVTIELSVQDKSALVPTIEVSEGASISPSSGVAQDFTSSVAYTVTAEDGSTATYTVSVVSSIIGFSYDGKRYEIVKENRSWVNAAQFAVDRGGYLAEINDEAEQLAIEAELAMASILSSRTLAPDGGNAAYVWIGGNDLATEGEWLWDGNNDGAGTQFWQGDKTGGPVGGLYENWGDEPDDFGSGQDGLGLALTAWPLGLAGNWNDVDDTNRLYFVIEYD